MARFNGRDKPLAEFISGTFDSWQAWQTRKNFERPFVLSVIQTDTPRRWLYAGLYRVSGSTPDCRREDYKIPFYRYNLSSVPEVGKYAGRMYLHSDYNSRSSYLTGERMAYDLSIEEISSVRVTFSRFPGYRQIDLSRQELGQIITHELKDWRTALSTVKGIYLLTDSQRGMLYVGQAAGEYGIWERWRQYFTSGHGGNQGLLRELAGCDEARLDGFRFSILEVMDQNATQDEINVRESHWKRILLTRKMGYNLN